MTNMQENNFVQSKGLRIGSLIDGKYKIIAKIGRGGMSTVWLALNTKANKQWAIKEIRQEGKNGSEIVKQNLMTEIGILKKLDHENLPQIIDIFEKNDTYLIIMDYVQGRTLKDIVDEHGPQPQEDVVNWAIQLCSALDYLHTRNPAIIYRDLKPGNVMLRPDGRIVLIDFGTAREYKVEQIEDTVALGTKGYAAPEQYGGDGQTDARTDIYNLGATIYHLVTGKNPTKPPYEIRPIRQWDPNLSSGLEAIILKCIANNPDERYQSAKELQFALEHYREFENSYIKETRGKVFLSVSLLCTSVLSLVVSGALAIYANSLTSNTYENQIHLAASQPDQDGQVKAYFDAIKLDPKKYDAYDGLLNKTFLKDGVFSQDEAGKMTEILGYKPKNGNESVENIFKKNSSAYDEFAYNMGLAYFYYYGEYGNKQLSKPWFDVAKSSSKLSKLQVERAKRFSKIADYSLKLNLKNKAGDSNLSYKDYWDDLVLLASGDIVKEDNIKTALIIYKELTSQILSHANDFKNAGVQKDALASELDMVEAKIKDIKTSSNFDKDLDQSSVNDIYDNLLNSRRIIDITYSK